MKDKTMAPDLSEADGAQMAEGVTDRLDALRARTSVLDAAALVDFEMGTVLGASSNAGKPQEMLEDQCRAASFFFRRGLTEDGRVVIATRREVTVLVQLDGDPGCALCFFFDCELESDMADKIAVALAKDWT